MTVHRFLIFDRRFECRFDRLYDHPSGQASAAEPRRASKSGEASVPTHAALAAVTAMLSQTSLLSSGTASPATAAAAATMSSNPSAAIIPTSISNAAAVSAISRTTHRPISEEESRQLIIGLLYSLKNMLVKLSKPVKILQPNAPAPSISSPTLSASTIPSGMSLAYRTSTYRLQYYETATGWRFIMILDAAAPPMAAFQNASLTTSNVMSNPLAAMSSTFSLASSSPVSTTMPHSTSRIAPDAALKEYFEKVFVKQVIASPLYTPDLHKGLFAAGNPKAAWLDRPSFLNATDRFMQELPFYK